MAQVAPAFKEILPNELYILFCSALYNCRLQYDKKSLDQLSRLIKRWFHQAENNRVAISDIACSVYFFAKNGGGCLLVTPFTGAPVVYDLDMDDINTYILSLV